MQKLTRDTLFDGRLVCRQHAKGYRFSVDAVLLAHFVHPSSGSRILDLGAGCGIISLILAYRPPELILSALELQEPLADLCRANVRENRLEKKIEVINGDLRKISSLVKPDRRNPAGEQAVARHELQAGLEDILTAAAFAVKNRGKVALVYPGARLVSLLHGLRDHGLEPKRLQMVHGHAASTARLVLVEAVKNGGEGLDVLPPFYIYRAVGSRNFSDAMLALYRP
ncbi:MAG: methyltransferase [Deltaproteobacteria bacterium]